MSIKNEINIEILLDNPYQHQIQPINTLNTFTHLNAGKFPISDKHSPNILSHNTITFMYGNNNDGKGYEMSLYNSQFTINQKNNHITIAPFKMYIAYNQIEEHNKGFGFGFKFKDKSFSFIHSLYTYNYINFPLFIFSQVNIKGKSLMNVYFGLPDNNELNLSTYKSYGKCRVNNEIDAWSCKGNKIKLSNSNNELDIKNVIFGSNVYGMICSNRFLEFISKSYPSMNMVIDKGRKILKDQKDKVNKLLKGQNIMIEFGNRMKMTIPILDLFTCDKDLCMSQFYGGVQYKKVDEGYNILLGRNMFYLFNAILFDYDDQSVSFYSNNINIINVDEHTSLSNNKMMMIYSDILCIIGIALLYLTKREIN